MQTRRLTILKSGLITSILIILCTVIWWWSRQFVNLEIKAPAAADVQGWPAPELHADDWPWWRGPTGDGHAQGDSSPLLWSTTKNIKWKVPIPGRGHASPILYGTQVFILTADEEQHLIHMLSYERTTGQELWRMKLHEGSLPIKHLKNSYASSTPACDGKHIYSAIAIDKGILVSAISLKGELAWQTLAGPFISENGYGSSVVVWGPYIIVAGDSSPLQLRRLSSSPSFLAALDRRNGTIAWRVQRPLGHSYGTPVLACHDNQTQIILAGPEAVISYDPANGRERWRFPWVASRTSNTPVISENRVLVTSTLPLRQLLCLRLDQRGKLSEQDILWKSDRNMCDVPSPIVIDDHLYLFEDNGVVKCMKINDGNVIWRGRLGSGEAISASPICHGPHIFAFAESGKTYVYQHGDTLRLMATNDLEEEQMATPALAGGELYIRTRHHLWCISEQKVSVPHDTPN